MIGLLMTMLMVSGYMAIEAAAVNDTAPMLPQTVRERLTESLNSLTLVMAMNGWTLAATLVIGGLVRV